MAAPVLREATVVRERLDADEKRLLLAGGEELGPPLRERAEDILLLLRHFVQHFARQMNRTIDTISSRRIDAEHLDVYVRQIEANVESWRKGLRAT